MRELFHHGLAESIDLGVNSFIVEPVDFQELTRAVGERGLYWLPLNELPS